MVHGGDISLKSSEWGVGEFGDGGLEVESQ